MLMISLLVVLTSVINNVKLIFHEHFKLKDLGALKFLLEWNFQVSSEYFQVSTTLHCIPSISLVSRDGKEKKSR